MRGSVFCRLRLQKGEKCGNIINKDKMSVSGDQAMVVMSFNIQHCMNFLTKRRDYAAIADAVARCRADIVGLNEVIGGYRFLGLGSQPRKLARLTGFKNRFFAKAITIPRGAYGNALLSRYPILEAERIKIPYPSKRNGMGHYEKRCILKAHLANGYTVLVTHFGLNRDEQENAVAAVLENLTEKKCILMGDFNVQPDNDVLSPIRERMRDTAGLLGNAAFSFPSDSPKKKIDYIFVSKDIELISAEIPPITASDHRPYVAVIR